MLIGEEYTVKIEKMLNNGEALARVNSVPVFISGGCPGDIVKIKIAKINKSRAAAEIIEIIEKSASRIKPVCALHNVCGSCSWLHIDYKEQLKQKQLIVKESIEKIAGIKAKVEFPPASPLTAGYRCKIQLPVSQTKISKRLLSGYYKKNSHELVNIKYCPMQPSIINDINEFVKLEAQKLNISCRNEKTNKGLLRHIIYRISSDLKQILIIFVINSEKIGYELKKLSDEIYFQYPQVTGICANFNTEKTNVITGGITKIIKGNDFYIETLGVFKYKISAGSFFQVNPLCAELVFNKVRELISSRIKNPAILDAYSGVSSFGIWLSPIASKVVCIEEIKSAADDAIFNVRANNINNVEIINGDAAVEFKKLADKNIKFDIVLTDPPRKGCSASAVEYLTKLTSKYIVYVSCNPSSLARDIKILQDKGFNAVFILPVDMFPNTYHVETIVLLEKT